MSDPILTSDKVLDGLARDMARLHTNGGSLPKGPYRGAQAGVRNAAYWTGRRVAKAGAEAHSVSSQRLALQVMFAARGWDYALAREYVDDGISGATAERPGYQQLRADVEAGTVARICTYDMDRISRDPEERAGFVKLCMAKGTAITEYASGDMDPSSPTGMLLERVKSALAEFQRSQIKQRTRAGIAARVSAGEKWGGARCTPEKGRRGVTALDEADQERVRELIRAGAGGRTIARELGISDTTAHRWRRRLTPRAAQAEPAPTVS